MSTRESEQTGIGAQVSLARIAPSLGSDLSPGQAAFPCGPRQQQGEWVSRVAWASPAPTCASVSPTLPTHSTKRVPKRAFWPTGVACSSRSLWESIMGQPSGTPQVEGRGKDTLRTTRATNASIKGHWGSRGQMGLVSSW